MSLSEDAARIKGLAGGNVASKAVTEGIWNKLWLPFIVLAVAYSMQRSVAPLGLDLHHDTLMFDAAKRALNGEIPFRDFFYQYNLGTVYFHVLALKVFGTRIISLKIATAIAYASIALLIYVCAAIQGRRWWGFGLALLWSTLSPFHMPATNGYHAWSTVYMMVAVMAGALFLSMGMKERTGLWSASAGVCFNLAFWFKQVAGLQILVVLVWILVNARRTSNDREMPARFRNMFVGFAAGGLVSALPFFFYIFEHDLFFDWWRSAFVFNGFFALSGHSISGLIAFIRTVFPVAKDMGYLSVIWAILPLYLLTITVVRDQVGEARLFARRDASSRTMSLFVMLGFAGWAEFFPLAHAFHTQLFLAPVFVLLALRENRTKDSDSAHGIGPLIATSLFVLTVTVTTYEGLRHLQGLKAKLREPVVMLQGNTPVTGLALKPEYARSFDAFYEALITAKDVQGDLPSLPMSVDPLRALLPGNVEPRTFKMGVDWTWPNEIVEPGFNDRLLKLIAQRKALIYADSLVAIPGYIPVALLEMPAPITASHTLYVPSADATYREPPVIIAHDMLFLSSDPLPSFQKSDRSLDLTSLFRLDELGSLRVDAIDQLHVTIVRRSDFPSHLSDLQYEKFLLVNSTGKSGELVRLYRPTSHGGYELTEPLSQEQALMLAKFLLFRGNLFEYQDRPIYFSSLSSSRSNQPFLVRVSSASSQPRLAWKKSALIPVGKLNFEQTDLYLGIPRGVLGEKEMAVLCVQIVMRDRTTRNFYLYYLPA
jgi:hypothetical protein